ncbi:sulfatase [Roseibacillus persicicus]|uniref:Iduronate-2-sulfatase n=1 Tax=Roseibacillus persicicus TaxID=454148 RepID=A0A918THV6_9BACT|nr:sulfatase [Roseibacillus persicicus]GHC46631.1 iduronate-2-sulfatase [Roseibacillus persicicus]
MRKYYISLVVGFVSTISAALAEDGRRPNILFVAYDDLRPEMGAYGAKEVITPNLDKLAAESTRFENAYVNYPLCMPSRSSMLSGIRFDNRNFTEGDSKVLYETMLTMQSTWPAVFHEAGYWTATRGKLYHGHVPKSERKAWDVPGRFYGQPEVYRLMEHHQDKVVEQGGVLKDLDILLAMESGPAALAYLAIDCADNELHDGEMAEAVVEFLAKERDRKKPFLISAGFTLPHLPWIAPKKYFDMYPEDAGELAPVPEGVERVVHKKDQRPLSSNIWNEGVDDEEARRLKRAYLACTTYADAQMGKIIEALKETGEYENTIIVMWGDHGYHLSEHGLWQKNKDYRVSMRCPLMIKAPGVKGGQVCERVVQNIDIYPTLLSLAGIEKPEEVVLHGRDLKPLLENPNREWERVAHVSCVGGRKGVISERYRFTEFRWGEDELYDLEADPDEWVNLAGRPEYAEKVKEFKKEIAKAVWNDKEG